jgi:AcrR family transcriptional regulator
MPTCPEPQPSAPDAAPRKRRRRVDRRAVILAAARRRFAEFGFEATTVRQIADDVDLLSGSLYHHFDTKEAMLDEVVRAPVLALHDETLRIAALPIDPETRLVTLVAAELDALTRHQEQFAIVYSERKFFRRSPYFEYLMRARKEAYDAWAAVLAQGAREGQFDPVIDPYLTISTIMRMLNTGADWYRNEDGSPRDVMRFYPLGELLGFYLGFVLRAVRLPARAGQPIPDPCRTA